MTTNPHVGHVYGECVGSRLGTSPPSTLQSGLGLHRPPFVNVHKGSYVRSNCDQWDSSRLSIITDGVLKRNYHLHEGIIRLIAQWLKASVRMGFCWEVTWCVVFLLILLLDCEIICSWRLVWPWYLLMHDVQLNPVKIMLVYRHCTSSAGILWYALIPHCQP